MSRKNQDSRSNAEINSYNSNKTKKRVNNNASKPTGMQYLESVLSHQMRRFIQLDELLSANDNVKVIISGIEGTLSHTLGTGDDDIKDWKKYKINIKTDEIAGSTMFKHLLELIKNLKDKFNTLDNKRVTIGPIGKNNNKQYCNTDSSKNPSATYIHVWGANENNWNLPVNSELKGSEQADCMKTQSPGVFGIVTTLKKHYRKITNLDKLIIEPTVSNGTRTIKKLDYTDEIKTINTNIIKILDIIRKELDKIIKLQNNKEINNKEINDKEINDKGINKTYITLKYYIDNFQNIKLQYDTIMLKNINSKKKIETLPEAQNYYKFLLEANFFAKIITVLNYTKKKEEYIIDFSNFINRTKRNYDIDIFNEFTDIILDNMTQLKQNNRNHFNKNVNTDITPIKQFKIKKNNINTIISKNSQTNKKINSNRSTIENEIEKLNNSITQLSPNNKIKTHKLIEKLATHIQKLNIAKKDFNNKTIKNKSKSFFNKLKKNTDEDTNIKQSYYRLLLEHKFISNTIKKIKTESIKKDSLIDFFNFLEASKNNYSFKEFTDKIENIFNKAKDTVLAEQSLVLADQRLALAEQRSSISTNIANNF